MKALAVIFAAALLASCSGMGMHRSSGTGSGMGSDTLSGSSFSPMSAQTGHGAALEGPYSGVIGPTY